MRTQDLIAGLAADAAPRGPKLATALLCAGVIGAVLAAVVMQATVGVRSTFVASLSEPRFLFKFLMTAVVATTAFQVTLRLSRPDRTARTVILAFAIPALVLAVAVAAELTVLPKSLWLTRLVGRNWLQCLAFVPLISATPLLVTLLALRQGAPASPTGAGLAAGIACGALGAFFYAAHCPDDSPLFVAVWYILAIGIVATAGALIGRWLLRW